MLQVERRHPCPWLPALCATVSLIACTHDQALDTPPHAASSGAESTASSGGSSAASTGGAGQRAASSGLSFEDAMQQYNTWTQATAEPQAISAQIASLCRAPNAAELAFEGSEHGAGLYLHDWLNPAAVRGRDAGAKAAFAAGAAIVKQKLAPDATGKLALVALGIMIKREPGFDPAHGDWAFGYWEASAGLKAGLDEARHCGGCHASAATDFVFLDQSWRTVR